MFNVPYRESVLTRFTSFVCALGLENVFTADRMDSWRPVAQAYVWCGEYLNILNELAGLSNILY